PTGGFCPALCPSAMRQETLSAGSALTQTLLNKSKPRTPYARARRDFVSLLTGGTGLGLAISKQLIGVMDGNVAIKSKPGKGSTFRFTARLGKTTATSRPRVLQSDLRGRRVLIVDDNPHARAVLSHMLTSMTFVAEEAACGEEAIYMVSHALKRNHWQ